MPIYFFSCLKNWRHCIYFKALYSPFHVWKSCSNKFSTFVYFYAISFKIMGLASTCLPSHISMFVYFYLDVANLSCYKYTGSNKALVNHFFLSRDHYNFWSPDDFDDFSGFDDFDDFDDFGDFLDFFIHQCLTYPCF